MKINTDQNKINDILSRGVEDIIEKDDLMKQLLSGKMLRIKHGIDPTGPKIHIGRATQLHKLRAFQELGHKIVLIIGDFTAMIGDASDKQAMRQPLTEKEIKANMKDYAKQIGKILDMKKVEIRRNNEWFGKMKIKEFVKLQMLFTAQQTIQRRNFKERWDEGKPIGLHELDYPLFQGYDSVAIKADVEIGGSDQLFNLKSGREIQKMFDQKPQNIITFKMLNGLDGRKMSTSWGNIITIVDEPNDMFGKIMSMSDGLILEYFELCTRVSLEELENIKRQLQNQEVNPRDLKVRLAKEIITLYHGEKKADLAEKEFENIFKNGGLPEEITEVKISEEKLGVLDLLVKLNLSTSKGEARRLVEQNGVKIGGEVENDSKKEIEIKQDLIVQVGKRRFAKIVK